MSDEEMCARQTKACAALILEITQEHKCTIQIEHDEVTVYDVVHGMGAHAHHNGRTLYHRLVKALETAKGYAQGHREFTEGVVSRLAKATGEK